MGFEVYFFIHCINIKEKCSSTIVYANGIRWSRMNISCSIPFKLHVENVANVKYSQCNKRTKHEESIQIKSFLVEYSKSRVILIKKELQRSSFYCFHYNRSIKGLMFLLRPKMLLLMHFLYSKLHFKNFVF